MKFITFLSLLFLSNSTNLIAQDSWVRKEVDGGIFVKFPFEPQYKVSQDGTAYLSKTTDYLFMVIIQRNILPNYGEFINLPSAKKISIINILLDNAVKGKLAYTNSSATSSNIKVGKFIGRSFSYSAVNPTTGEVGLRQSKMILVNDRIITFECLDLKKDVLNLSEKQTFFSSITTENIATYYIATSERSYFYDTPNYLVKRAAYITKGEIVSASKEENNFIFVSFTNSKGITTKGWISKDDLTIYN